jgi:predicted dehydrogenase
MSGVPLHVGVCGLGSIGRRHARLLTERADVHVHVFDPARGDSDNTSIESGALIVEPSFEQLLAMANDGVVIATPDAFHAPLTVQACHAGVPVMVEKPVADSQDAAREMERVAERCGVPVLVGHVLRHVTVLSRVRTLLHEGTIGTPLSFHATLGAYETLEAAHMRLNAEQPYRLAYDYSHEWDYVQWLLGRVVRCSAVASCRADLPLVQSPNVIEALLELETGTIGSVHLDYVERVGARGVRIVGDRGVIDVDLREGSLAASSANGATWRENHREDRDVAFARQLSHFVDVIRGHSRVLVSIAEARQAVAVAEAVRAACERASWQDVDTG